MGFSCGIVGLPNTGKTTLFNALTKLNAETATYSNNGKKPNIGMVPVLDHRLFEINRFVQSDTITPALVKFIDISIVSKNGKQSEELGSETLGAIKEMEALVHVVRLFDNPDIPHSGDIDPIRDIETLQTELALKDIDSLENIKSKLNKKAKSQDKTALTELELINTLQAIIEGSANGIIKYTPANENEAAFLKRFNLLTLKPMIFVANISEEAIPMIENHEPYQRLKEYVNKQDLEVIPICAKLESEINELSEEEAKEFALDCGIKESGINVLVRKGYSLLNLLTYFTAGEKEVRAWTITTNSNAKKAAGKIHSDLERGFIRAEVIEYNQFLEAESWSKAREKGSVRLEGKEYIVKDGDIVLFRFNV